METKISLAKEISQTIKKQRKERFINKAPNNSMRLFALVTLFPDAKFINVARDPREVISSMITRSYLHNSLSTLKATESEYARLEPSGVITFIINWGFSAFGGGEGS